MFRSTRQRPMQTGQEQDLDSFLDILTNVIGILILIAVCVAIFTSDIRVATGTPLLRTAQHDHSELTFLCEGGKLYFIPIRSRIDPFIDGILEANPKVSCQELVDRLNNELSGQGPVDFEATVLDQEVHRIDFFVSDTEKGESAVEFLQPGSRFRSVLNAFDNQKSYIFVFVKPDSFGLVESIRKVAESAGFESGWEPLMQGDNVYYSNDGGSGRQNGVL